MTEHRKQFGQQIRTAREAAHLTRETVAEKADIGFNYLGQIERGQRWPKLEVIVGIANAIGVPPTVFLDLEPIPDEPDALRVAIGKLLQGRNSKQLHIVFRVIKALLIA